MISQSVSRFGLWYSFIATANLLNPFSAWTCSDSHIKDSAHPTHQLPGIFTDAMSIRASPTSCLSYAVFPVTFTGVPRGLKRQRAHDSASSSSSGRFPFHHHHHHSIEVKCWKHYVIGQGKSKAGVQGQVTHRGRILLWEQVSRCNPTIRVFDRGLSLHGTNWLDLLLPHPPVKERDRKINISSSKRTWYWIAGIQIPPLPSDSPASRPVERIRETPGRVELIRAEASTCIPFIRIAQRSGRRSQLIKITSSGLGAHADPWLKISPNHACHQDVHLAPQTVPKYSDS